MHSLCVMTGVWVRHVTAPLCLYEQLGAEQCISSEYVTMTCCVCIAHYKQTKLVVISRMLWRDSQLQHAMLCNLCTSLLLACNRSAWQASSEMVISDIVLQQQLLHT